MMNESLTAHRGSLEAFEHEVQSLSEHELAAELARHNLDVTRDMNCDDAYIVSRACTVLGLRRVLAEQRYIESLLPQEPVTLAHQEARALLRADGVVV